MRYRPQAVVLIHDGLAHSAVWMAFGRLSANGTTRSATTAADTAAHRPRHHGIPSSMTCPRSCGISRSSTRACSEFTRRGTVDRLHAAYSQLVKQLVLVGPVVSGMPYTDYFLTRGAVHFQPIPATDTAALIAYWNNDKYVLAPGHDSARARLHAILASSPQDLAPSYFIRPIQPALPRLARGSGTDTHSGGRRRHPQMCTPTRAQSRRGSPALVASCCAMPAISCIWRSPTYLLEP